MGVWCLDPLKYVGWVRVCFDPLKSHILPHSKLLLDNSASFTSWRMKDLCQKMEGKTNRGAWNSLMAWPDWPDPLILQQIYATEKHQWPRLRRLCGGDWGEEKTDRGESALMMARAASRHRRQRRKCFVVDDRIRRQLCIVSSSRHHRRHFHHHQLQPPATNRWQTTRSSWFPPLPQRDIGSTQSSRPVPSHLVRLSSLCPRHRLSASTNARTISLTDCYVTSV